MADVWGVLQQLGDAHWPTLAFGVGSLAAMLAFRRWLPRLPGVLITVAVATALSAAIGFDRSATATVASLDDPEARVLATDVLESRGRLAALAAERAAKQTELARIDRAPVGGGQHALALGYQVELLGLQIADLEAENGRRLRLLRKLTFELRASRGWHHARLPVRRGPCRRSGQVADPVGRRPGPAARGRRRGRRRNTFGPAGAPRTAARRFDHRAPPLDGAGHFARRLHGGDLDREGDRGAHPRAARREPGARRAGAREPRGQLRAVLPGERLVLALRGQPPGRRAHRPVVGRGGDARHGDAPRAHPSAVPPPAGGPRRSDHAGGDCARAARRHRARLAYPALTTGSPAR